MSSLDLARLQFGSTSIYHFLFVPVSIGLAFLVALLQTGWYRNNDETYLRLARFFGTLLLINVAIGVVTGLIQEFEFGMNWSVYSKLVGNVFGGPLAFEGLGAFFLESTFLGLWIFGWNRLSKRAHLACIWTVAFGTVLSAAFIMAANSWMQHPVGYKLNSAGEPVLTNIFALFTNPVFLWSFTHVVLASLVTGAVIMLGVSAWQLRKHQEAAFRRTAVISLVLLVLTTPLNMFVGSELGVIEGTYQPDEDRGRRGAVEHVPLALLLLRCSRSAAATTTRPRRRSSTSPDLLSILATNHVDGQVQGMNQLNAEYQKEYGPGNYIPNVFIQYWSMRVMAYLATLLFGFALWGAWLLYRHKLHTARWFLRHCPLGGDRTVPHQHRRLDAHGERAAALDRPRAHEDGERGVPVGVGHRHLDLPHRLLPDLHRLRYRRRVADDPLQPQAARPRPHFQAHRRWTPDRCRAFRRWGIVGQRRSIRHRRAGARLLGGPS